jgi:hypothetical protein
MALAVWACQPVVAKEGGGKKGQGGAPRVQKERKQGGAKPEKVRKPQAEGGGAVKGVLVPSKTYTGTLSSRPLAAGTNTVAVLTVAGAEGGADKVYNLITRDPDMAKKIGGLVGLTVTVQGEVTIRGDEIDVSDVTAGTAGAKPAGGRKHRK